MKKGTKIKTKQTRFEKVHKEQWIYGLLYRDECFKPITPNDILTYKETINERIVFSMSDGLLIFIHETLFDINNYKQL